MGPDSEKADGRIPTWEYKEFLPDSNALLSLKPTYEELLDAIDQFTDDRTPTDINMLPLFRVWVRANRETIKPCPECDGECDEPCNTNAEEMWAMLDNLEEDFSKR